MGSSKQVIALMCGVVLGLCFLNSTSWANEPRPSPQLISDAVGDSKPGKTIKGEVVRVENEGYFHLREENGTVTRVHVDKTTINVKTPLKVKAGDFVEAKVDDRGHAISFVSDQPMSH
ncbi:MAG: hypothetical protein NDI90_21235 [Nitrospira sp. BO4]|jgi:hypothetical protein|nr:hypothetical protein [Nitrospira sp. BO4]